MGSGHDQNQGRVHWYCGKPCRLHTTTKGESICCLQLGLVGARPVREATGRIVAFDLIPLNELERPRIDVLSSLSGIFRDSLSNICGKVLTGVALSYI